MVGYEGADHCNAAGVPLDMQLADVNILASSWTARFARYAAATGARSQPFSDSAALHNPITSRQRGCTIRPARTTLNGCDVLRACARAQDAPLDRRG
jgi:expansin (peptidoglycan-binding protein)